MASGPDDWNAEREGRLALLLQQLARSDEGEEAALIGELRELSGADVDGGLSRWLQWYLEEHLGIRPVLDILVGRDPQPREGESGPALLDEQVFTRPEYNWCAIERVKNRDDMVKLRQLYLDLETPPALQAGGPFGFARLTGLAEDELTYYRGKTLTECLFDDAVQVAHLRVLKDYGKMMMMPVLPSATQRAGAVLYAASIAQALVRFDTKISSLSYQHLSESLESLLERPYVVETYARLFRAALDACS
ncbi:MAG: hypothetical protein ACOCX4_02520 [Planctomycetota bacterium]